MVKVKICGITNLADAMLAVEAGADALGFNFWPHSSRFISPPAAREIIERVPPEIFCVGVFVNEDAGRVREIASSAGVGAVQLHGDETPQYCRALKGMYIIKALRVGDGFSPEAATEFETQAILLDAFCRDARGGTGKTFDWTIARRVCALVPSLYLAGGLSPENIPEAIEAVRPDAVDVCSGVESAPGVKDAARVRAFVAAVRGARRNPASNKS